MNPDSDNKLSINEPILGTIIADYFPIFSNLKNHSPQRYKEIP